MTRRIRTGMRQAGFTLFELVLVIVLVAVMMKILLERFLIYQEMAEKVAMEQTVGALKSALNIQTAALIASGRTDDVAKLTTINPFTLLADKQRNYIGELFKVDEGTIEPGNWYFDLKRRQAVYVVARGPHFVPDEQGRKEVRYKVELVYNEGLFGDTRTTVGGVVLKEVKPYTWNVR